MKLRAVIFDRDGVLNEDVGYPHRAGDLRWIPGAIKAVGFLNRKNILVIVASNQSGVARGYFDEAAVRRFHDTMQAVLRQTGAHIDAFYYCPYHHEAAVEQYRHPDHPDRKPNPGMILRALEDWGIRPDEAILLGDMDSDIEAARRAGVPAIKFGGGDLFDLVQREIA